MIFEKVMTKTDMPHKIAGNLRPAGDPSPAIDDFKIMQATSGFVFVFFENYLQDLKIENLAPNYNFDEIMIF